MQTGCVFACGSVPACFEQETTNFIYLFMADYNNFFCVCETNRKLLKIFFSPPVMVEKFCCVLSVLYQGPVFPNWLLSRLVVINAFWASVAQD